MTLTVSVPTFTLSGPGSLTVGQGSTTSCSVFANPQYGFSGSINLSVTGLPAGVTASFGTNPTAYGSQMTISAAASAVPGTYTATLTGIAGSLTVSTTFGLTVGSPTFTISGHGTLSLSQGGSQNNWVYLTTNSDSTAV